MDDTLRGVFATRAPRRPNPIGLSTVRLLSIDKNVLQIEDIDIVDGTPLLDIKPYVPRFDLREDVRCGWLRDRMERLDSTRDDGRFAQ
jgi:tRNA-Thr(GGU) m(6)t(6)A37 methyltransferase TsaA